MCVSMLLLSFILYYLFIFIPIFQIACIGVVKYHMYKGCCQNMHCTIQSFQTINKEGHDIQEIDIWNIAFQFCSQVSVCIAEQNLIYAY